MFTTRQSREYLMNAIYGTIFYGSIGIIFSIINDSTFIGFGWALAMYGISQLLHKLVDWVYDGKEKN